jgi:hypothetical protein
MAKGKYVDDVITGVIVALIVTVFGFIAKKTAQTTGAIK